MHSPSPLADPHDIASLLAAAAQRLEQSGGRTSLTSCLLDEVLVAFSPAYIHVWEVGVTLEPRLIWQRGTSEESPDSPMTAATGVVKRKSGNTTTSGVQSPPGTVTSCEVADGIKIVLELALLGDVVQPQQMLELVEVLADLHRRDLVSDLLQNANASIELHQILMLLHSDLDPIRVASSLASDAAEFLGCCRISVARRNSLTSWELVAATAVSQPDPRSDASRQLCGIIEHACQACSVDAESSESFANRRLQKIENEGTQRQQSGHRVQPLSVSGQWKDAEWAAVFEWQTDARKARSETDYKDICKHATLAFRNCSDYSNTGVLSALRQLPRTVRSWRLFAAVGVTAAISAGLIFFKMDLQIEAPGKLVPSERIFVFAPEEGVITDVFVEDGTIVAKEFPLCVLRNEDLEFQLESIEGEVASAQSRLAALDALRGDRSLTQSGMVSVDQAELKERLKSLEAQAVILNRRIARLTMTATMPGQVYGDRLLEFLKGRPVHRGQFLFEIADPAAGWQLDLRIPEVDVRHVIHGQDESHGPLSISFTVETDPEKKLTTTLSRLSASTEVDEYGRLSVRGIAVPDKSDIPNPRPGAGVVGHIHCGRRSAGYVFFRRLIESFQRRWWK